MAEFKAGDTVHVLEVAGHVSKYWPDCVVQSVNVQGVYIRRPDGSYGLFESKHLGLGRRPMDGGFAENAYGMSPAALEHFSKPDVQAWMRERVKEREGARFYVALPSLFKGATARAAAMETATVAMMGCSAFSSRNGFWESYPAEAMTDAWNEVVSGGCAYADKTGTPLNPARTAKQYQELFGKPAPAGMFGAMSESALPAFPTLTFPRPATFKPRLEKLYSEYLAFAEPKEAASEIAQSKNCASCGDALNDRHDPTRIVDGQRHHGTCADRIERLKAAAAPKVTGPDPYAQHRLSRSEELNRAAMDILDAGFVSRFKADQPATKYREKFGAHPWECDADV